MGWCWGGGDGLRCGSAGGRVGVDLMGPGHGVRTSNVSVPYLCSAVSYLSVPCFCLFMVLQPPCLQDTSLLGGD